MYIFYKVGAENLTTGEVYFYNGMDDEMGYREFIEMSPHPSAACAWDSRKSAEQAINRVKIKLERTKPEINYGEVRVYKVTLTCE
jgi:hypothetical protein